MRHLVIALASASLLSLAACGGAGGGGVESLGSVTPPKVDVGALTPSPTPTPTSSAHFLDVSSAVTTSAIGGLTSLTTYQNGSWLYTGNAATVATPSGTVVYDPRDGIFTLTLTDTKAGVDKTLNFQDPAHRTDFIPGRSPVAEVPNFANFNYLTVVDGGDTKATFFYQRPGAVTKWVTLAGFKHRTTTGTDSTLLNGAFVFGTKTAQLQVPLTGSGSYTGNFLAALNTTNPLDKLPPNSAAQWISGTSAVEVNFASRAVALSLTGTVSNAYVGDNQISNDSIRVSGGTAFSASGSATLTSLRDTFVGKFDKAAFTFNGTTTPIDFTSVNKNNSTAGASSIDGTFYGANAAEVGGSFRITAGTPDGRIDILGGFTGTK